jgi:hypothetical protein
VNPRVQKMSMGFDELQRILKERKFVPRPMIWTLHVQKNGGLLPDDIRAHACWYYIRCAHIALMQFDDGAQYEGEIDHVNSLNNIARSVAAFYQLESPSEMIKFIGDVRLEAMRCNMGWDVRVEDPIKYAFRDRGNG